MEDCTKSQTLRVSPAEPGDFLLVIKEAKNIDYIFSRPFSNQALIISMRIDVLAPKDDQKAVYGMFSAAQDKLQTAIEGEYDARKLSLLYNNQASTYQDESNYDRSVKNLEKARRSLELAQNSLDSALDLNDIHPAVYSTLAEIRGERMLLDLDEGKDVPFAERTREVVDAVKKAIRAGYTGWRDISATDFFATSQTLERLRQVDVVRGGNFEKEIREIFKRRGKQLG